MICIIKTKIIKFDLAKDSGNEQGKLTMIN